METNVKNDWIVANVNNPNLDVFDLTMLGDMNTQNTQLLSKDEYLKSDYIKNNDAFKDNDGNFSSDKFDIFYNQQAQRWGEFQQNTFPEGLKLDYFDTRRTAKSRTKSINFDLGPEYDPEAGRFYGNPDRVKIGIEGWNTVSARTQSEKEIAESQRIFNPETGEFEMDSPDDNALFASPVKFIKNIFSDPLVLAVYDQDEIDKYGIEHKKGERKLNDNGTYYTERLNGRSPMDKEVISFGDLLTKEDSLLNRIDFMDSDDLEKSVGGVIAKNIAKVAPLFIPGVGAYYSKALIAREMAKALPMLYGVGANLFSRDDIDVPGWINTIAAKGEQLTGSSSVYAGEHTFSFENFANLASDVALQWGQQKEIAKAVQWLGKKTDLEAAEKAAKKLFDAKSSGKLAGMAQIDEASAAAMGLTKADAWKATTLGKLCLEKAYEPVKAAIEARSRFGADLALAYMAIISNTDVYSDMIDKGATNKEASWVTLASTAGMFSVDKFLHIGEIFYDDLTAEAVKESRRIAKNEIKQAFDEIYKTGTKETPKTLWTKFSGLGKKLGNTLGDYWDDVKHHNLGGLGKAVGEGLEEVSEELVTDVSKGMYSLLGDLGLYEAHAENPIDWDTAFERYAMSFLGGTVGGGIFYAKEKFANRFNKREDRELVDLIRANKANELRQAVLDLKERGKVGSQTLSGINYVKNNDSDSVTWLTTTDKSTSQNDMIADRIIDKINALEATIVGNRANLDDDALFDQMVLGEARYQQYKNASHVTGYYQEFKSRLNDLIAAEQAVRAASETPDGNPGTNRTLTDSERRANPNEALREQNLQDLQEKVVSAKKALDDFLSGDTSLEYTEKLNFVLDPVLNSVFLDLNYGEFMKEQLNFDIENPGEDFDLQKFVDAQKAWLEHVKAVMSSDRVNKGFAAYKVLEKSVLQPMLQQQEVSKTYAKTLTDLQKLYELNPEQNGYALSLREYFKTHKPYNWNSRLIDESGVEEDDETYNNRNNAETPDAQLAQAKRVQRIADLNRQLYANYVAQFENILSPLGYQVDAASMRNIIQSFGGRIQDIIKEESQYGIVDGSSIFDPSRYRDIITTLKEDLSNVEEVKQAMIRRLYSVETDKVHNTLPDIDTALGVKFTIQNPKIDESLGSFSSNIIDKLDDSGKIEGADRAKDIIDNPIIQFFSEDVTPENYPTLLRKIKLLQDSATGFGEDESFLKWVKIPKIDDGYKLTLECLKLFALDQGFPDISEASELPDDVLTSFYRTLENNISNTLTAILPTKVKESQKTFSEIIKEEAKNYRNTTIGEVKEELLDAKAGGYSDLYDSLYKINASLIDNLITVIDNKAAVYGGDLNFGVLLGIDSFNDRNAGTALKNQVNAVSRYLQTTVSRIQTNPLYSFKQKLQVSVHSPLETILQAIVTSSTPKGESLNITGLLDAVYKSYVNADSSEAFIIEDTQLKNIESAKKALEMVRAVIYACSTSADGEHYFGQHKQINDFAANHRKQLIKEWQPLPEIATEYGALLMQETEKLYKELSLWRIISDRNAMNKLGRLVDTESALNQIRYNALKKISLKFTIDDKEYDLSEGLNALPAFSTDKSEQLNQLFIAEQTLYNNFQRMLKETGKTAEMVLSDENFVRQLVSNIGDVKVQKVASLTKEMDSVTGFDNTLFLLTVLSDNPTNYYSSLKGQIEANSRLSVDKQIAPLTVQQNISRLGEAAHTKAYKAGFKTLSKIAKVTNTITPNTVYIDGRAGAGKTEVVLKAIRQRFKEESALIIGPTSSQAIKLQNSLGEATSYTFDEQDPNNIFKLLLGEEWNTIKNSIASAATKLSDTWINDKKVKHDISVGVPTEVTISTEYFDITRYYAGKNKEGVEVFGNRVDLHLDKIKFNPETKTKLVFVDEAAHLNTVQIALLDAYAEKVGGTLYLASDSNQSGFKNGILENLEPSTIFCSRTAKLTESLRSSNIQMQSNGDKVSNLLDIANEIIENTPYSQAIEWLQRFPDECKKLKFRVYNEDDDINGWLIGANIDDTITRLKKIQDAKSARGETMTLGFIGDESSSIYQAFRSEGINVSSVVSESREPNKPFMQGQEFDYVFIDHLSDLPSKITNSYASILFLKRINTLATRGKVASIFADNLSPFFGENTKDTQKSIGFSIKEQVSAFRENYLESLNKLNLTAVEEESPRVEENKEEPEIEPEEEPEVEPSEEKPVEESKEENKEPPKKPEESAPEPEAVPAEGGEVKIEIPEKVLPAELNPESEPVEIKQEFENNSQEVNDVDEDTDASTKDITYNSDLGSLTIEANTVVPILSLETTPVEGKKYSSWRVYQIPEEENITGREVRRNLQVFCNTVHPPVDSKGNRLSEIVGRKQKLKYQGYLNAIQSYILFGGDTPSFLNYGTFDWKKMSYEVEFRPATDIDTFGIGTDLKPTFVRINGKPYVMALTVKVPVFDEGREFDAIFDVCLLSDPVKLNTADRQNKIKENISKSIQKLQERKEKSKHPEVLDAQIKKAQNFADNLGTVAAEYNRTVQKALTDHPDGLSFPISEVDFHKTTRLVKRRMVRRLGSHVNIANIENHIVYPSGPHAGEYIQDTDNFIENDSRKIVSGVYIVGKQSDALSGAVDESVMGKAVVFTSCNTNLRPDELVDRYIAQKTDPENHTPEVRMVVLNNHGLSFRELIYNNVREEVSKESSEASRKLWRKDILGIRMFSAMWNWRAALKNFNKAYSSFWFDEKVAGKKYDEKYVEAITRAEYLLYRKLKENDFKKYPSVDAQILSKDFTFDEDIEGYRITKEDLLNLRKFNLEICKNIPIFRLGYPMEEINNGGYIRPFDVRGSSVYEGKDIVNLFAIGPKYAEKYYNILNVILSQLTHTPTEWTIISAERPLKSLNTRLVHEDGQEFAEDEYIGKGPLSKNLSGMIRTVNKDIIIQETDESGKVIQKITISPESMFSYFPKALAAIVRRAKTYQSENQFGGLIQIGTITAEGTDYFNFDIGTLFGANMLTPNTKTDNTLFNLLELCFHGSTQGLEEWRKPNEDGTKRKGPYSRPYLEDAFAKFGFFVDPDLERSGDYKKLNAKPTKEGGGYTFLKCSTSPAYFDVDVDVIPGGVGLNLQEIVDGLSGKVKTKSESKEEEKSVQNLVEISQAETEFAEKYSGWSDWKEANDAIFSDEDCERYLESFVGNLFELEDLTFADIKQLNQIIAENYSGLITPIKIIEGREGKKLIYKGVDNKEHYLEKTSENKLKANLETEESTSKLISETPISRKENSVDPEFDRIRQSILNIQEKIPEDSNIIATLENVKDQTWLDKSIPDSEKNLEIMLEEINKLLDLDDLDEDLFSSIDVLSDYLNNLLNC